MRKCFNPALALESAPRRSHFLKVCLAGVATIGAGANVFAGGEEAPGALEEVIVTASKRSESVQDVPSSIRAFSGEELARLHADSIQDYAALTPGLQLTGSTNNTQLVMRGVTTGPVNHDQSEIQETVGLYLDETPIAVQRFSPNLKLYDLERIEVLRGPQGTLYGAGSMAGAVRMITRRADPSHFDASADVTVSSISNGSAGYSFEGMLNMPVSDTFAIRAVGFQRHDGGYIDNTFTHKNDVNDMDASGGRLGFRWISSDRLTVDGMLFYQKQKMGSAAYYAPEVGDLKSIIDGTEPSDDRDLIASLSAAYSFDSTDLTISASHLDKKLTYKLDDGTFTNFVTGIRDGLGGIFVNKSNQKNTSIEARLASKAGSRVQWTGGVFFQKSLNFYGQDFTVPGVDAVAGFSSTLFGANKDQLYFSAIDHDDRQYALFGEVVVPLADAWKVTLGGRYFRSTQKSVIDFRGVFADPAIGVQRFRNSENGFNPKLNVSYDFTPDATVYAQVAKGFRLGGTNEPVPLPLCRASLTGAGLASAPEGYKSDSLWNYEVGAKTQWLQRRLTINGSVYRVKWRDPQVTAQLPCGFNVFTNAGGLDIQGGEIEIAAKMSKGLTARVNVGMTDSQLSEDNAFLRARRDDRSPYIPRNTFSGSLDYGMPVSSTLEGFGLLVYSYQGSRRTKFSTAASDSWELPAFGQLNAKLGVRSEHMTFELYGDNLADKRGVLNQHTNPFHLNPATDLSVIQPRTLGLRVGYKY